MIRVLHVVGKMHRAGQETITMNLYRAIDRERLQFDFLVHTKEKCDFDDEILRMGGRIFHIAKISRGIIRYVLSVKRVVRDNGYDIVHLHTAHAAGFFVLLGAKLGGAKVRIAHSRNDNAELPWLHRLLRPLICRYSTDRFACSTGAGRWMFGQKDFIVKRNAIDTEKFHFSKDVRDTARQALALGERLTVGHVGRFTLQKNHVYLMQVLSALKPLAPDFCALLIGDGELRADMEAEVIRLGLADNVRFLGSRGDVPQLMQAMDAFVFPSLYEGFGNVVVEAQATGLQVLASDTLTRETQITDRIRYLSIKAPPEEWARAVTEISAVDRTAYAARVADAGFDVYREAAGFMDFYLSAAKR